MSRPISHHEIRITGIGPQGDLILVPASTAANADDTVTWIIDTPAVQSIIAITPKQGNSNVFDPGPSPVRNSRAWKGTIRQVDSVTDENYTIVYTKSGATDVFTFDPTIRANP